MISHFGISCFQGGKLNQPRINSSQASTQLSLTLDQKQDTLVLNIRTARNIHKLQAPALA